MPYIGNITQDFNVSNAMLDTDSVTSIKIVDGTIEGADIAANLDLSDNQKIRFGAGNDLQIYHDGSNSYVQDSGTGNLIIAGSAVNILNAAANESMIRCTENGSAELWYDNSKKLETSANGVNITGNIFMPDSTSGNTGRIKVGDQEDLQIYHTGSHANVDSNTGDLYLTASGAVRVRTNDSESAITCLPNGAVELYYDNSKKFETTSTGVALTGNLELAGAGGNVSTNWDNAAWEKVIFDASYNTNPQGPNKIVLQNDTSWKAGFGISSNEVGMYSGGNIVLYSNTTDSTASTKETLAKFIADGAVELYHNNVKALETYSNGIQVGFDQSNPRIMLPNTGIVSWGTSDSASIQATDLGGGGYMKFNVANANRLTINANGLCFNNDTAAANALDDYEEGTWTPSIVNGGSPSYSQQSGLYTKIGNLVRHTFVIGFSGASLGNSSRIGGLPFAYNSTFETSTNMGRMGAHWNDAESAGSRVCHAVAHTGQGTTRIYVDLLTSGTDKTLRGFFEMRVP